MILNVYSVDSMSEYVIGMNIGIALGIAIGISIGIAIGKKQKPWSELSDEEKRMKKIFIGSGFIMLALGVITFLWFYFI
jgi:hypothetical protein